ncbi:MAG: amidohydrolase family protein [Actinobacteria bacterium]|nr:amidohydrolase family protein [Actinomycetota bacterium]
MRVCGGLVVTGTAPREGDILVRDGRIAAIEPPTAGGELDARGCVVLPGGVDPHTHPLSGLARATTAAGQGGTTTVFGFTAPRPGESPGAAWRRAVRDLPQATVAMSLHPAIWEPDRLTRADLEELRALGASSVKLYLAYPELGMMASDRTLYETLRASVELGLLVMVHCENGGVIEARVEEQLAHGATGIDGFVAARATGVEEEAVARTLALARLAEAPVYLVHLSSAGSLVLVREARAQGQRVIAEACAHHLLLDESCYERPDPGRWLIVPPLRSRFHVDALWDGVHDGTLDTIGSDHAQVAYQPAFRGADFRALPSGFPGIETRVPLVLSEGARRGVTLERLASLLATTPARTFRRESTGAIVPGAAADLLVWDPSTHWTVDPSRLHGGHAWTPYDGIEVMGEIRTVIRDGAVLHGPPEP